MLKVVPWGLRKVLNNIKNNYDNPPVIVISNGYSDSGELNDTKRIDYHRVCWTNFFFFSFPFFNAFNYFRVIQSSYYQRFTKMAAMFSVTQLGRCSIISAGIWDTRKLRLIAKFVRIIINIIIIIVIFAVKDLECTKWISKIISRGSQRIRRNFSRI